MRFRSFDLFWCAFHFILNNFGFNLFGTYRFFNRSIMFLVHTHTHTQPLADVCSCAIFFLFRSILFHFFCCRAVAILIFGECTFLKCAASFLVDFIICCVCVCVRVHFFLLESSNIRFEWNRQCNSIVQYIVYLCYTIPHQWHAMSCAFCSFSAYGCDMAIICHTHTQTHRRTDTIYTLHIQIFFVYIVHVAMHFVIIQFLSLTRSLSLVTLALTWKCSK